MRSIAPMAAAAAVVLALAGPALAQPKNPAELFPAQTLAYLEVRQPDKLAREAAALIKGSALEDLAAVFAKARTERGDKADEFYFGGFIIAEMGVFLSPEGLAEFGRVGGGAVAITGWSKEDGPEVVGVIYPGECNLVTMFTRMALASDSEMRIVEKVEGVNLYRARGRDYRVSVKSVPGGAPPPPPPIVDKGPTFALMPGLVVIASTPRAAKEVVRRAKGKVAEPALVSLGNFKRSAALREKPGVFAYADVGALAAQIDGSMKGEKPNRDWNAFKTATNPQGLGPAFASLTLDNGTIDFRLQVQTDPGQPSPLLELLSDKKAPLDGLHFAPKDGLLTVTMALPDGAKRWEKLVALLDGIARQYGDADERLPSKALAAAEEKAGINLGKDVFAKVAGVTLTLDLRGDAARNGPPFLLALTATDEDTAKALEDVVPKVVGLGGRGDVAPEKEKVEGLTLYTFPPRTLPWPAPLSYGREGKTLVLGQTKEGVAAALRGGAKNGGLLGDAKVAAVLKDTDDALAVGVYSVGETLAELMKATERPRVVVKRAGPSETAPKPPKEEKPTDTTAKFVKELTKVTEPLPPAVVTLSRKGDVYVLELKQTGLKTVSAKVINVFIDRAVQDILTGRPRYGSGPINVPDPAPFEEKKP